MVKEKNGFIKTIAAIALISICLIAANWQFHRGQARHALNSKIEANIKKTPLNDLPLDLKVNEWRPIILRGQFIAQSDLLQRNSYRNGVYGYELLSRFKSNNRIIWIDRGWVKAGATAETKPELPETPIGEVAIEGRIRSASSLVQGRYFALPTRIESTKFRIDLIKLNGIAIENPAQLPELSDGPHYAYALQWLFFAGLVIYGRLLIRRQALRTLAALSQE